MLLTKIILLVVLTLGQESPEATPSPAMSKSPKDVLKSVTAPDPDKSGPTSGVKAPQRVLDMEGTFNGAWTSYRYENGKAVKKASWTDTLICSDPRVIGKKSMIDFSSESTFEGQELTRSRNWREGYFLTDIGGLGDRYVEYFETVIRLKQVSDTIWTYSIPMSPLEFSQLGFESAIRGEHIVIMTEQKESGVDTRRLIRVTSIVHNDDDGDETTTQFVSLRGYHKRAS